MMRARVRAYRDRVWRALKKAFDEKHATHDVAVSFGLGTFVTVLPTLGTGLLLFPVFVYLFERVSKLALLASVAVFNPVVKWGVYATSYWLGSQLLGPLPVTSVTTITPQTGTDVLSRLLLGNAILAVFFAVAGYAAVFKLVVSYRERNFTMPSLLDGEPGDGDV